MDVSLKSGSTQRCTNITTVEDSIFEFNEVFVVIFSIRDNDAYVLGSGGSEILIINNDGETI